MKKIISNAIFHLPKNKFQYSSLPSHNNKNNLEEFVKKEIFSSLQVCSKTKTILEDEDTQDETIKRK